MDHHDEDSPGNEGNKSQLSPLMRALVAGLGMTVWSSIAIAGSVPLPDIKVVVRKHSGGIAHVTRTNKDGIYKFTGLMPGKYDLTIVGKRVQAITVDEKRTIAGMLRRNEDGSITYTFDTALGPPDISTGTFGTGTIGPEDCNDPVCATTTTTTSTTGTETFHDSTKHTDTDTSTLTHDILTHGPD
ncbi:MAG: hypothetical protein COY36_04105, partial [Zetaproteobacteria bacterium CG_4_10_14_0_2_um_filter_55_20]